MTRLLSELQDGDESVRNELFDRVYDTLRLLAKEQRRGWEGDYTLNTTALVHEAYIKLVDQSISGISTRAHFLNVAAKVMRHLLVDYARTRGTLKRGGNVNKVSIESEFARLTEDVDFTPERAEELLLLDRALKRLASIGAREAEVVECRFFGGMSVKETAVVLNISPTTVKRDWAFAQAWLRREMS